MVDLLLSPVVLQIGAITIVFVLFTYAVFKYITYTTPNPDAKIKLSDKDPNHKLKGYRRQDLSIHELRKYDGKTPETNYVVFVAVNGFIFDVTVDRHLYGPGGHYFAFAGRDASRALSKFTMSCDSLPTEEDLMPDLSSSEVAQLNEWYGQFSERYQCVGRLIRSNQERYVYDHSDDDILNDSEDTFEEDIDKYCGIQSEVAKVHRSSLPHNDVSAGRKHETDSTDGIDQRDCSSDQYNKPLLNELNYKHPFNQSGNVSKTKIPILDEDESSNASLSSILNETLGDSTEINFARNPHSSSSRSLPHKNDLLKQ